MKRLLIFTFVVLPMLTIAQDDLYFTSSKKAKEKTQKSAVEMNARVETLAPPTVVDYRSNRRSEDEYNRRYIYSGDYQNAGGVYADSLAASIDTIGGYYSDVYASEYDLEDPELDYRFSRRLVRFHNPRLYALASPYYWDLYYGYGAWDYLYDPYDPWYHHYGWRYGWTWGPWDCWYGGIWGWHSPYAWSYWGWGPGWHHPPMHGGGWHYGGIRNIVPRQLNSSRGHMAAGNRLRTNASGRTTMASRSNVVGGSPDIMNGRSNPAGNRVMEGRTNVPNSRTRTSAVQRGNNTTTRNNNIQPASRSTNTGTSNSRSSSNSNYTTPSRSSSTYSGGSRSSNGGGSFGGSSRGSGSFGGGSRGGGGRR